MTTRKIAALQTAIALFVLFYSQEGRVSGEASAEVTGDNFRLHYGTGIFISPHGGDYSSIIKQGEGYAIVLESVKSEVQDVVNRCIRERRMPIVAYRQEDVGDSYAVYIEDDPERSPTPAHEHVERVLNSLKRSNQNLDVKPPTYELIYGEGKRQLNSSGSVRVYPDVIISNVTESNKHLLDYIKAKSQVDAEALLNEHEFELHQKQLETQYFHVGTSRLALDDDHRLVGSFSLSFVVNNRIRRSDLSWIQQQVRVILAKAFEREARKHVAHKIVDALNFRSRLFPDEYGRISAKLAAIIEGEPFTDKRRKEFVNAVEEFLREYQEPENLLGDDPIHSELGKLLEELGRR